MKPEYVACYWLINVVEIPFFLISNKYALIKGKPKYTGSEQRKRNYKQKLQESRKSIKEGEDWLCKANNQSLKVLKKISLKSGMEFSRSSKHLPPPKAPH